jgi:hypothetical protein
VDWKQWDDDTLGRCYASGPYIVRQDGYIDGVMWWRGEGPGMPAMFGTDPDLLKLSAEDHHRRQQRTAVGGTGSSTQGMPAAVDENAYRSELGELRRSAKELTSILAGASRSTLYRHGAVLTSKDTLIEVRNQLEAIIDRLP